MRGKTFYEKHFWSTFYGSSRNIIIWFEFNSNILNFSLGVAFTGLNEISEPLYPMICSTAAKTEMSLGVMKREFLSMQDRCRATIIRSLTNEGQIEQLLLPRSLKVSHILVQCLRNPR